MNSSSEEQSDRRVLCYRNCGLYGNPETHYLCSNCYRAYLKEEAEKAAVAVLELFDREKTLTLPRIKICPDNQSLATEEAPNPPMKKNRCHCCNKKTGLTGFNCRCGGVFCSLHRYPEEHECKFDFKTLGRHHLAKQNPLCIADKLDYRI